EAPLTTIGSRHLFRYRYLTTVKLPNCLREIPDQIFEYCNKLEAIELPDSLRKIGNNAFENTSLKSITLPDSLNSIGSYAFASCYMLKDVKLPANLTSINSGAFKGCSLTEISLPAGLESIGGDAFLGCPIKEISLPAGLKSIGGYAFEGCPIKEISLPAGLEDLGFGAFAYTDIESVTIPAATTVENPFYCCRYLKNIFVDKANEKCFDIDGVLYNKYYPVSSTGTIEPGECWNRLICYPAGREDKTYNVPEDTKVILQNAFTGTCNLHSVYANEGLAYVAQFAFCKSSVEYIDLPSTIEGMYFSSFGGNSAKLVNLKATTVPERFGLGNDFSNNYEDAYRDYPVILCVPENSAETYRSISGIESSYKIVTRHVEAADVHYVSENEGEMTAVCATYDADSTLTINDEVTDEFQNKYVVKRINDRAFYNAYNAYDSLKTIAFPATVEYIGTDAMNAPKLKEIRYTAEESPYFTVMDGVLFSKDTTTLMKYPSMKEVKTYVVPATVDSICQNAMFLTGEYPLEDLYILNKGLIWKSWSYVSAPNTTLYVRQSFIGQDQIDDMEPYFKAIVVLSDEEADRLLTDIQGVSADSKNGVADDGWYYTLSGMRVKQPAKGLYIRNGKKVVIK
ncbi:MAG: leucine-rich repeat protein, partial [Prevotella sp.]